MRSMIRLLAALAVVFWSAERGAAQNAQDGQGGPEVSDQTTLRAPIVTLDRDRLFEGSLMGKAILKRLEQASNDLIAENRRLEQALEQEERDLTELRKTLPAEDFRTVAAEFDTRVEELRAAQDAKSRVITRQRELDQQIFFEAAVPILGRLMTEIEAVAIIDRSAIILTFDRLDITDLAIDRLDTELGEGPADLGQVPAESGAAQDGRGLDLPLGIEQTEPVKP
jgi:Skp family chaperone for outer membrane proteins